MNINCIFFVSEFFVGIECKKLFILKKDLFCVCVVWCCYEYRF